MDTTALPFFIALSTVSEATPATFAGGMRYNSLNKYLQSKPTTSGTNAAGYMVATLVNQTGGNMSDFDVRYDLTAGAAAAVDDCAGLRFFISPNGSPNSWVAITGLDKNITTGPQSGNVLLSPPIANNQTFYLLWVDDNDDGDTDPAYTIDNLAIVFANQPPVVSTSPANQTVAEGSTVVMSVVASGATSYKWFKGATEVVNGTTCINGGDKVISGATTASLTIANAKPADSGVYHAQAFNGVGNALSANATLTVNPDTNCPVILYVYPGANNNQFILQFSKAMDDDCAGTGAISDPSSYQI
jgi:hypothetical protein